VLLGSIAIRGAGSRIVCELLPLLQSETIFRVKRGELCPPDALRYVFCQGALSEHSIGDQGYHQVGHSFWVNGAEIIRECDRLFALNSRARICVVGSESAFSWSHDGAYAAAKAALTAYVETKRLRSADQQLICIAPSVIADTAMTEARTDRDRLEKRLARHPKGRFLRAVEVARLIHHVLYVDEGYLSGTTIRMNGGAHTVWT
jgi:NAD(P)-dependent dehydrogenase (short-subunit alcohol dehydrogenase family)